MMAVLEVDLKEREPFSPLPPTVVLTVRLTSSERGAPAPNGRGGQKTMDVKCISCDVEAMKMV